MPYEGTSHASTCLSNAVNLGFISLRGTLALSLLSVKWRVEVRKQVTDASRVVNWFLCRWLLQRRHVDHESKLHIASEYPFISFVDLLDGDQFDVRLDLMLRAEVEHFLRFLDAADEGTGEPPSLRNE